MKILTVLGARPQLIKAAPVCKALRAAGHQEFLLHTGQHYDYEMSQVFFEELDLPAPSLNLGVGSGLHGWQTAQMLAGIETAMLEQKPDWVLVYGDTNSTLAGALAAIKLHIPIAHIEAGLRSFNRQMPEEHNRVLTDHCADLLFCPTQTAVENLAGEGINKGVHWVGDTMYDAVLQFSQLARHRSTILQRLDLQPKGYLLATLHRPYNTDDPEKLSRIMQALLAIEEPVIFPVHPRTRQKIAQLGILEQVTSSHHLKLIPPVGYLDMLMLEQNARLILTDSGGMQKEAYFFAVPCLTLRPETEWVETVQAGWNLLVGSEPQRILAGLQHRFPPAGLHPELFGDGQSAQAILAILGKG